MKEDRAPGTRYFCAPESLINCGAYSTDNCDSLEPCNFLGKDQGAWNREASRTGRMAKWSRRNDGVLRRVYICKCQREKALVPLRILPIDNRSPRITPAVPASWPPAKGLSQQKSRYGTGFPNTLLGGASQGSDPVYGADKRDPYRQIMEDRKAFNYPRNTKFDSQYREYKKP